MVGQPHRARLALALQLEQRAPVVAQRRAVLGRPVHLIEIDLLDAQPAQRRVELATDAGRVADHSRRIGARRVVPDETALGEDERPFGARHILQCTGDDLFGVSEPVYRGGVDPVDAAPARMTDGGDRRRVVLRSPAEGPAAAAGRPGAEADPREQHAGGAERPRRQRGVRRCHHVDNKGGADAMSAVDVMNRFAAFLAGHPEYESTRHIDAIRSSDYARLDAERQVYLDYTGASLYAESQLHQHLSLLQSHVFGNPHSGSLTSMSTTSLVERARAAVLEWFNAREYTAVFTINASAALKLVGESYPFGPGARL